MEYYAKSPTNILKQNMREQMVEKLKSVVEVPDSELDDATKALLQDYIQELQTKCAVTEHKTLKEHLEETVRCAENFFEQYGMYFNDKEKELILKACRLHDIGKANFIFQTLVNKMLKPVKQEQIPHGFLSAFLLSKEEFLSENPQYSAEDFRVLLTAVYYHHTRQDVFDFAELEEYCRQYYLDYVRDYLKDTSVEIHTENVNQLLFSERKDRNYLFPDEEIWCAYMLVKGMLNKFDWTVSAGYKCAERTVDITAKRLCSNITSKLSGNFRPVQQFMIENRENNVVMIAPTGSGKTEAALLWLNGEKGFYTLPLKVSSNAIYRRIRQQYQYEDVALLHSDSINSYLEKAEDLERNYQNYEQARLLSFPLTVCTVDQLFRFVYKALGTEIFAATLKYAKIVIDEIQSYSPRVVAALIFGLSELKRMGGRFAIITATFPPVLQYFMKKNKLRENRDYVWHDFSESAKNIRHRIRFTDGDFDLQKIAQDSYQKKVLVICNTVSRAQEVYKNLRDQCEYVELLHARFIREHRTVLEQKIMDFSACELETGIWVTTQIVEASLDIDFDILYTELCTADSLLQRMGRCNRAGKKDTEQPNVIICQNGSGCGTVYDKVLYARSADFLKKYDGALFSEMDKVQYINAVYETSQIQQTGYFKQIEEHIKYFQSLHPGENTAAEAQKEFRAIQSITVIPETVYIQNCERLHCILDLLAMPCLDRGVRSALKAKIADMTLSLNTQFGMPDGIDRDEIGPGIGIHRANLYYEFDGNTGIGLELDKVEDEAYFV